MHHVASKLPLAMSIVLLAITSHFSRAESLDSLYDLTLEELLNVSTNVASNTEHSVLEQPSIISLVTRDQIIHSGARDLVDVMRMIPGFGFAHDTLGINSWGFRGIWGHEGKIMLIVDGAPHNDAAWGNLIFGRRFPVELIDKVEIIRGPGAAKFGNYAELAVVKVTTVGKQMNGGFADVNTRAMEGQFGSAEFTGAYGQTLPSGLGYSLSAHVKNARRTTRHFSSADGNLSTDQKNAPIDLIYLDGKVSYQDVTLSTLVEQFSFEHQESLLQIPTPETVIDQGYRRFHLGADYAAELTQLSDDLGDDISLNGKVLYQETLAHNAVVIQSPVYRPGSHYGIDTQRFIGSVDSSWQINEQDNLNVGMEYFRVKAIARSTGDFFFDPAQKTAGDSSDLLPTYYGDNNQLTFNQKSVFFQFESYNDWVNYTLGARWASHSATSKSVVVPRIGLAKSFGHFGIKLMYNEAFRTGDAEHLNLAVSQLDPEELKSHEVEFSYLADSGLYKINFFKTDIKQSIVFNSDAFTENSGAIASKGLEASYNTQGDGWTQELTISIYRGDQDSSPAQLAINKKEYLGFPTFKATWQLDYNLSDKTVLHPTIMFENEKYWRTELDNPSKDVKLDAVVLLNIFVTHQLSNKITLQAGVHDLFNDGYFFPQAYGQVLYPGDSRELSVSISYEF